MRDLTIYYGQQKTNAIALFSNEEHWKATYQKNVELGRIDPNYVDKYPPIESELRPQIKNTRKPHDNHG